MGKRCVKGVMVVTERREAEHRLAFALAGVSRLLYGSYRRSSRYECLTLPRAEAPVVIPVTAKHDSGDAPYPIIAACCSHVFPSFASAPANHLHSDFATAFAAVRQRMPLQEPFGDPRPQAFFFP